MNVLVAILHWIWPPGRCQNCHSIYSTTIGLEGGSSSNLQEIHRSTDGKFIVSDVDTVDGVVVESKRNSIGSQYSSSDDGGFLSRRGQSGRSSWRRPLVTCPSQLSFRSDGSGQSRLFGFNLLRTVPQIHHPPSRPITENLHINTISANVPAPMISSSLYTPSRVSRVHASSPATSSPLAVNSPWSPLYFSDLSSVHPSSAERSLLEQNRYQRQQQSQFTPSSSRTARYINELPALRMLHEETHRMTHGFIPVHVPSPPIRSYYANVGPHLYQSQHQSHGYRPRVRIFPRFSRMMRSAPPELSSPVLNLNINSTFNLMEQSPESQSSSSGFGSKNTSSQQNQSSQSGGTNEWRYLPPYRPPPPAPQLTMSPHHSPSSPYSMSHWLELITRLNSATEGNFPKSVDVGSVDGHYEFDPSTPTPTASTPTGRDDAQLSQALAGNIPSDLFGTQRKQRNTRYDNIDARVQAMKEEFYAFRKRQAMKRGGIVLESAC